MQNITSIVITGGPGGGKSGLNGVRQRMEAHGYRVIIVPEIASEFFISGLTIGPNGLSNQRFQQAILQEQINREEHYKQLAAEMPGAKKLVIFYRGVMDCKAYMREREFVHMIHEMKYRIAQLRDERYAGIFHLESAAVGAKEWYTTANNPARKETPAQAAAKDMQTRQVWVGHPHLRIIKSSPDFNIKMQQLVLAIERLLGIPEPLEIEKKFLVKLRDIREFIHASHAVPVNIEQVYLKKKKNTRERIRKRSQDGYSIYYRSQKERIGPGINREIEARTDESLYKILLKYERDHSRDIIRKKRYCFLYDGQYFELDIVKNPKRHKGLALMELELDDMNQALHLPPYVEVIREVTNDIQFTNSSLAKK